MLIDKKELLDAIERKYGDLSDECGCRVYANGNFEWLSIKDIVDIINDCCTYTENLTIVYKYRVGVENETEHIDCWDYEANEYELAEARFENIKLEEGQVKYLMNLLTEDIMCFEEK